MGLLEMAFTITEDERDTYASFTLESVVLAAEDRRRGVSDNACR
jgi:hypothetical protein